jgi:hypothetical protein
MPPALPSSIVTVDGLQKKPKFETTVSHSAWREALVKYLIQMSNSRFPVPIEYITSFVFIIACGRKPEPLGKNWIKAFEERQSEL